jgi:hypothetical protein
MYAAQLDSQLDSWDVQRRNDGAVLVRVHSCDRQGRQLPDAVFAFRLGDPQYDYWERQLRTQLSPTQYCGNVGIAEVRSESC